MRYKKMFIEYQNKIKNLNKINTENMNDKQYYYYWYDLNNNYECLLIYLYNYLVKYEHLKYNEYGFNTKNYHILLNYVRNCIKIGDETNYYNNKYSRKLINLNLTYFNMNNDNYLKDLLNLK